MEAKRGSGQPPKTVSPQSATGPKRGRGRPRKNPAAKKPRQYFTSDVIPPFVADRAEEHDGEVFYVGRVGDMPWTQPARRGPPDTVDTFWLDGQGRAWPRERQHHDPSLDEAVGYLARMASRPALEASCGEGDTSPCSDKGYWSGSTTTASESQVRKVPAGAKTVGPQYLWYEYQPVLASSSACDPMADFSATSSKREQRKLLNDERRFAEMHAREAKKKTTKHK